jgi:acyl-CoA dehydrogenase
VFREMQAVANDDGAEFDAAFWGHVGFAVSNSVRSLWLGLTGARLVVSPVRGRSRNCYQQLTRMSAAFALVSDAALLVLGGSLKRREKLSGRLADVLSQLYLASAALKRFEDQGRPAEDVPLMQWVCDHSLYEMQRSMNGLLKNFPNRAVAWVLRRLVFPLGKPYAGPSDNLGHQCADVLLSPSEARDRLTRGLYVPTEPEQALAKLEQALVLLIALEPLEKRIRAAVKSGELQAENEAELWQKARVRKVIDEKDFAQWQAADQARRMAVMVDEFDKSSLACHSQ